MSNKIISLFSGAGGLDLGFKNAGFDVVWANEYDESIKATFERNHSDTYLNTRDIRVIPSHDIPDNIMGIIGGPPCQSWSEAGALKGIDDDRGKLFYEYVRVIQDKQPLFFLAENVRGILSARNKEAFSNILVAFERAGYMVSYKLLNACDYGVPQDRKRVIIVGYRKDLYKKFIFENIPTIQKKNLRDALQGLKNAQKAQSNKDLTTPNHEYMTGGFSTRYMARNRVRGWDEQSFTIQAGGRHAPLHPQAPKMQRIHQDNYIFVSGKEKLYRRLSVRECARIQTFPDDFIFEYNNITEGYKQVGNAVPVKFAEVIAQQILKDLQHPQEHTIKATTQLKIFSK